MKKILCLILIIFTIAIVRGRKVLMREFSSCAEFVKNNTIVNEILNMNDILDSWWYGAYSYENEYDDDRLICVCEIYQFSEDSFSLNKTTIDGITSSQYVTDTYYTNEIYNVTIDEHYPTYLFRSNTSGTYMWILYQSSEVILTLECYDFSNAKLKIRSVHVDLNLYSHQRSKNIDKDTMKNIENIIRDHKLDKLKPHQLDKYFQCIKQMDCEQSNNTIGILISDCVLIFILVVLIAIYNYQIVEQIISVLKY